MAEASSRDVTFRALLLGLRIDVRDLDIGETHSQFPLTARVGERGLVIVFRYGVAAFVDLSPDEERATLETLRPRVSDPLAAPEVDALTLRLRPAGEDQVDASGNITLRDASFQRYQVVANVISKSLVLAHHESRIAAAFDRLEPLAMGIRQKGRGGPQARQLVRQIGDILLTQHRMVGRVAVEDKPDVLWDRPELERLYARLADEYELEERGQAIDRKLALVGETVRTLLELVQDQRTVRLEWYIIGLIAIEILLSVYEIFFRGRG